MARKSPVRKRLSGNAPFPELETKNVPIDSVKLWDDNPRKNEAAAEKLSKLISIHGQVTPIVVWSKNNVIYKGNTTWKAIKMLGWDTINVRFVDFPSETAATAYAIADNKAAEEAEWDEEILQELLGSGDIAIEDTGFSQKEMNGLMLIPDIDKINKVNEKDTGIRDKIIVMTMDADQRDEVKELLKTWLKSTGLKGVEIK